MWYHLGVFLAGFIVFVVFAIYVFIAYGHINVNLTNRLFATETVVDYFKTTLRFLSIFVAKVFLL